MKCKTLITALQLFPIIIFSIRLCNNYSKVVANHGSFIPLRYSLTDSITQQLQENNPLFYDL